MNRLRRVFSDRNWWKHQGLAWLSIAVSTLLLLFFIFPYPRDYLKSEKETLRIFDRNGDVLMELTPGQSGFITPIPLEQYPRQFIELVLFSEDQNFYRHIGISFRSLARALLQNIEAGDRISGGSTITQQLVKYKKGRFRNNLFTKAGEVFQAVRLDLHFSKDEILEYYLNHIFMGYRNKGFNQAAEAYFGKSIGNCSILEMAALIQLIKGTSLYDIYHKTDILEERARRLLLAAHQERLVPPDLYELSLEQRLNVIPTAHEFIAPHFCFWVLERAKAQVPKRKKISEIHTTFDAELYRQTLQIAQNRILSLIRRKVSQAAVLILDNATAEVRVMLGSIDWYATNGQINGITMHRQPGSTMKAITYAMALDSGRFHLSSILPDIPTDFPAMVGKYIPRNYDERFHGPVRLAQALGSSYNVPAVYLAHQVGIRPLYNKLRNLEFDSLQRSPQYYGLGITLGNADVSILELSRAYMSLANKGVWRDVKAITTIVMEGGQEIHTGAPREKQVFSEVSSRLITHALEDFRYKAPAYGAVSPLNLPWKVAVKTGTTKDFRDNSVVAYTKQHTIGIWSGNFSGESMKNLPSGRGSGMILRDLLLEMYNNGVRHLPAYDKEGLLPFRICTLSGDLAGPYCPDMLEYYHEDHYYPREQCSWHRQEGILLPEAYREWGKLNIGHFMIQDRTEDVLDILSPSHNDIYQIDKLIDPLSQAIRLKAQGPGNIRWFINDTLLGEGKELMWQLRPGIFWLEVRNEQDKKRIKIIVVEE